MGAEEGAEGVPVVRGGFISPKSDLFKTITTGQRHATIPNRSSDLLCLITKSTVYHFTLWFWWPAYNPLETVFKTL